MECIRQAHFKADAKGGKPVYAVFKMAWKALPMPTSCEPTMTPAATVTVKLLPDDPDFDAFSSRAESIVCASSDLESSSTDRVGYPSMIHVGAQASAAILGCPYAQHVSPIRAVLLQQRTADYYRIATPMSHPMRPAVASRISKMSQVREEVAVGGAASCTRS